MLRLSKKLDYSLVILAHLARLEPETVVSARTIAEAYGLPYPITSSLLKTLVAKQIVRTVRGVSGGHSLNLPPAEITLEMIAEAIEGPLRFSDCIREDSSENAGEDGECPSEPCCYEGKCLVAAPIQKLQGVLSELFASITLVHLLGDRPFGAVYLSWESRPEANYASRTTTPTTTLAQ